MEKNSKTRRIVLSLLVLALLVAIFWGGYKYLYVAKNPASFVIIDINPSVELEVNAEDVVVDVIPLNGDADIIISDLDLTGLPVEEASEDIVGAAIETGYIDELSENNTIVVTSASDDEDARVALEEKIMTRLDSYLIEKKAYALLAVRGLDDELKAQADRYEIPYGRMLLISKAVTLDSTLNTEDLVSMSIQKIQREIKTQVKARHELMDMTREELKTQWQAEKQSKKLAAEQKGEQKRLELWDENKNKYSNATASEREEIIENLFEQEKEQIRDSIDVIEEEIQEEQTDNQSIDQNNNSYPIIKNGNKAQQAVESRRGKI